MNRVEKARGHGKTPNYVTRPAPAFKYRVGSKVDTARYDALHLLWRAGVIDGFYFGRRSPQDPTIVWEINGAEVAPELIDKHAETAKVMAGVMSVEWGEMWCGYRGIVVTFTSGMVVEQAYNGTAVVETVKREEVAA